MRSEWLCSLVIVVALAAAALGATSALGRVGKPYPGFLAFADGTVSNVDQPWWSGPRAGLRYLDRVVSADGVPVSSGADLFLAAERAGGRPVSYQVLQQGELRTVVVQPSVFGWPQLFSALLPLWLIGLLFAALGAVIAWLKPRAPFTLPFALACLFAGLIFLGIVEAVASGQVFFLFAIGFYLLPAPLAHLGLTFPEVRAFHARRPRAVLALYAACAAILALYLFTLGTATDRTVELHRITEVLLAVCFCGLLAGTLATLMQSTSDIARTRARLAAVGIAGSLVSILVETLAARRQGSLPLNVTSVPVLLFPFATGLAVARSDALAVDRYVRRGVRAIAGLAALVVSYVVLTMALRALMRSLGLEPLSEAVPFALAALLFISSAKMRQGVAKFSERLLYPRAARLRGGVARAQSQVAAARGSDEVAATVVSHLARQLGVRDLALCALAEGKFQLRRGVGRWESLAPMAPGDALPRALAAGKDRLSLEELIERRHRAPGAEPEGGGALIAALETMGAQVVVPLLHREEVTGFLLLGHKRGREPFNNLDEEFVDALATSTSLALEYARAFDEILVLNRDLEKRVEERTSALHAANQELTRATRFKNEFIRSVSHELRTPLNAVLGFNDLVLGRETALAPQSRDELGKVRRNAQALLLLIEDLLDLGRIEAGKFPLKLAPADPASVARDAVAAVEPMALEKKLKLRVEVDGLPPQLLTDGGRVRQILINLLGNAVKFTPSGEVALLGRLEGDRVFLEVKDSGPGIAPDQEELVFGEFVQLGGGDARGTGLGLGIARRLARLLGGDVTLRSELGKGASFTLVLPGALSTPLEVAKVKTVTRRTLLALSEHAETIVQLRELLARDGFDVVMAFDAPEVLASARETRPFAVALDARGSDPEAVIALLRAEMGADAPPSLLLPEPLERLALLEQFRTLGWS